MPSAGTPPGSVAFLTNSTSNVLKATYVPIQAPTDDKTKVAVATTGGAIRKAGFVRSLELQTGEVDAVQSALAVTVAANSTPNRLYDLLKSFEGTPLPSLLPSAATFSNVPDADLIAFGNALVAVRRKSANSLQDAALRTDIQSGVNGSANNSLASALNQLNTAVTATNSLSNGSPLSPVGMLNLERMEMTPAGIERGGLIATIPLAPKERTIVVQQEWSVISQDFTSIVTDSLDNYSATGVTDTTTLGQSTTSQNAHSNQFNVNASVSGSYGFVTASVATQFGDQSQNSNSATDSRQHAVQTTKKASSRSIQSHKITISTSTTSGTSNSSTRTLENPSATDPMRIDYFSIMRKWYVALYRYGLRLTYDFTVPEPAAAMREAYRSIAVLQAQSAQGFDFALKYSDITASSYLGLASKYGAQVPAPQPPQWLTAGGTDVTGIDVNNPGNFTDWPIQFNVPDGFEIDHILLSAHIGDNHPQNNPNNKNGYSFGIVGFPANLDENGAGTQEFITKLNMGNFLKGFTGAITVTCVLRYANPAVITLFAYLVPSSATVSQWQASVYSSLYNAAQTTFYANQQAINSQISALQAQINGVDTLTLRREENDEIMKCALRWILGDKFEFMPQNVIDYFKKGSGADLKYGIDFTGNGTGVSTTAWTVIRQNEDRVNFINQAIDWDNVLYYLYSYFWDVPESWDFIRQIQHPDSTRQAFLRAGSARVVLTVRKGWEVAWAYFVEFGSTTLPATLPQHPYLTIAQQIQDYDNTNYPGIPPADPNGGGPIDDGTPQVGTTCSANITPSSTNPLTTPVSIPLADVSGFVIGTTAIIDNWDAGLDPNSPSTSIGPGGQVGVGAQENQTVTAVDPPNIAAGGATAVPGTITVQGLQYPHTGPFPIVQAGVSGVLIGEWYEYTPTSGTDIAVTSNLATIT